MAKQLTILFWGFIYGEVIGYISAALSGGTFSPLFSGLFAMVVGLLLVNGLNYFVKSPTK
ncbi:YjzD family protein [Liquorilactobacillus mali]|uniref:DUF2929 domain-containing protein n=2 Tax=Liquorilactobacillus mali TaxID=1618 RepID=J0UQZ8_9LACO|nr:YjzD family protein [Liquorilactobacillus mali]EJE98550.1 hypothetical protein LMA_07398 [Liquorilactobacillus mali KCTC 3596 = DSM 20444]KRN09547.1 hypothetical protein FD00_GL000957 [Liquorilactobacillus mali KCTC 3596 = DSM 20444]KRN30053.1 hypothetical protein IV36_GL002305 [Liquorilactobacillus mali]MDC7952148.1 YjzD family protein [Liquorilactobacillus mali]MDN7144670.1 YjzD family protein [Liquorilactobacillus mali]